LASWIKGHFGRKVRLTIGKVSVEATTVKEAEHLLAMAKKFTPKKKRKGEPS